MAAKCYLSPELSHLVGEVQPAGIYLSRLGPKAFPADRYIYHHLETNRNEMSKFDGRDVPGCPQGLVERDNS